MTCISPPEPDVGLLMAFLDGEVDSETALHLIQCNYCRNRVEILARDHNILTSRLYRISCPPTEELGEFHLRMLSAPQTLVVAQHVRECPHCTREINQLEEFLSDLAPASEINLAEQAKVLIARLVSGPASPNTVSEPVFALRGDDKSAFTYEADGIVIVLDIQPGREGKANIIGQVAVDDQDFWTGSIVTLKQAEEAKTKSSLDDLGAFRFEQVSFGSIQIAISSPYGVEVQIPSIDI